MNKERVRRTIEKIGIIPAVRVGSPEDARFAAETVDNAGLPIVEITMTVPNAIEVIRGLASDRPEMVVGAGTVLDLETARRCLDAGASFVTSPGFDAHLTEFVASQGVLTMPGTTTPTEIIAALHSGADLVKVFPCAPWGGAAYIKALKAPFPDVPLVAAGGVNQQTAAEFIMSGAVAIGVATELIPRQAVRLRQTDWIAQLCRRFTGLVNGAREELGAVQAPPV